MSGKGRRVDLQKFVLFGILIFIIIIFSLLTNKFLTYINFTNVMLQISLIVLTGSAVSLLIISGGFDLSVGSVLAFTLVMHAYMCKHWFPIPISIIACVFWGILFGLINAWMTISLNIPPLIATMGSMNIARGLAWIVARIDGGSNISAGLPRGFESFGRSFVGPIQLPIIIVAVIACIFIFIQTRTNFGKYALAIGGNKTAAVLSGVKAARISLILYVLSGALTGFGGAILSSRIGSGVPNAGYGFEFDVITAVVLGGADINGGEGSVVGMIIGAFIVGFVSNGLNLLNVHSFVQTVLKGVILIGAILLDRVIKEQLA
jgi:ribose transport system permease protein